MNKVFLDTSFITALSVENDSYHEIAQCWARRITQNRGLMITHQGVLLGIGDAFSAPAWRKMAVELINYLQHDPTVKIVPISTVLIHEALQLFAAQSDKNWGMSDCLSFTVMRQLGLDAALTTNPNFIQAGFRALLRENPPTT